MTEMLEEHIPSKCLSGPLDVAVVIRLDRQLLRDGMTLSRAARRDGDIRACDTR